MKLLLMCEKSKPYAMKFIDGEYKELASFYNKQDLKDCVLLNETVVAECDYEVEEITIGRTYGFNPNTCIISTKNLQSIELLSKSCFKGFDDLYEYLKYDFYSDYGQHKGAYGYAIRIKNLNIFKEPKALRDYTTRKPREWDSIVCDSCTDFGCDCKKCSYYYDYQEVVRTPRNMMKVCEWDLEDKILIPLKPKDLCKILNKEKTIIIKKKVLKEMLK
jgi:hypothetical protein